MASEAHTAYVGGGPSPGNRVRLNVGGEIFETTKSTLERSHFFRPLIQGQWDDVKEPDGSYFVDADPTLFRHILNYLRRGLMPLVWTPEKGHDLPKYAALIGEARVFGLSPLENWLVKKEYNRAVSERQTMEVVTVDENTRRTWQTCRSTLRREIATEWFEERSHVCVNKPQHSGHPELCNIDCWHQKKGIAHVPGELKRVLKAVVIERSTAVHPEILQDPDKIPAE